MEGKRKASFSVIDLHCEFGAQFVAPSPSILNHLTLAGPDPLVTPGSEPLVTPGSEPLVTPGSDGTIPLPFPLDIAVQIPQFEAKEKVHRDYVNKKTKLSKLRKGLVQGILNPPVTLDTPAKRYEFLVERGRMLLEVTHAMTLELKYPKPEGVTRGRMKANSSVRVRELKDSSPEFQQPAPPAIFSVHDKKGRFDPGNKVDKGGTGGSQSGMLDGRAELFLKHDQEAFQRRLKFIFDDITPIPELPRKSNSEYWQFRAQKSLEPRKRAPAKRFWKRNSYPPKTSEERIKEMREKVWEEFGAEIMETDLLPGIWVPEFMTPEFEVTGLTYDAAGRDAAPVQPLDWYKLYEVKEKCLDWLNRNEKFL